VVLTAELSDHLPLIALCDGIWMGLGFGLAGYCRHRCVLALGTGVGAGVRRCCGVSDVALCVVCRGVHKQQRQHNETTTHNTSHQTPNPETLNTDDRIVTENTLFAMPENTIGLWPDVGFAFRAARSASPAIGLFMALTGARSNSASDLMWLGIATHYCPAQQLAQLREQLEASPSAVEQALAAHCVSTGGSSSGGSGNAAAAALPGGPGPLQRHAALLKRCFGPLLIGGGGYTPGAEAAALQQLVGRLEKVWCALVFTTEGL